MTRILVFSDIHLDQEADWTPPGDMPDYDVAVVAGDVTHCPARSVAWLASLRALADRPVVFIPGNGEFYDGVMGRKEAEAHAASIGTNVRFLSADSVVLDGVAFIGGTLWSDLKIFGRFGESRDYFADYLRRRPPIFVETTDGVRRATPEDILTRHRSDKEAIAAGLARHGRPSVVVTHHAPHRLSLHPDFTDEVSSAAYASDMESMVEDSGPSLWVHGHTHASTDYRLHDTRVVSNPKGFGVGDSVNPLFDARLVVEF
jgi:Icc-related predicted phosphoesterase